MKTESAWSDWVSETVQSSQPEALHTLRPKHTYTYVMDADSMEILKEFPNDVEKIVKRGVRQGIRQHWGKWKVRELPTELERKQALSRDNMGGFNDTSAWDRLTIKIEFYQTVDMNQIGPDVEGKPIVLDGRIIAASGKLGYIKEALVYCTTDACDTDSKIYCSDTLRITIPKCPECGVKMHMRDDGVETGYVQTIKVQDLNTDSMHKSLDIAVKVTGEDVFSTWIGKRIRIAGNFLTDIDLSNGKQEHKQYVFSKYIHEIEEVENICITKERAHEIRDMLREPENFTALLKSFAPNIEGKLLQKEALMYSFAMGTEGVSRRQHIHVLEIGNAGQGKSELIKQIPRVIAKSKFILANTSTAAGLGIGMVKIDSGTMEPSGGPLVMMSPDGHLALDELDKMHDEDRNSLLSSMENQVVTKVVAGTDLSLPSFVSIISAANPKWGQWDESHGAVENINFPSFLLTRFDVVTCSVKSNEIQEDEIANKILGLGTITSQSAIKPLLEEAELMQYINYCKKLKPQLTLEAKVMMAEFYKETRKSLDGDKQFIPITPRELEGLVRLVTARAKLLQKDEADIDDAEAVKKLKVDAMNTFPGVHVEHAGQQMTFMSESDDKEKTKLDIITSLKDEDETVSREEVMAEWIDKGVFKTSKRADQEFTAMIGESIFMRGSRYVYRG
jgi:DNA replicative helicase MCM subunit Mcm2 (Cdc46/Mcm family)